jgi:hypothetical protein
MREKSARKKIVYFFDSLAVRVSTKFTNEKKNYTLKGAKKASANRLIFTVSRIGSCQDLCACNKLPFKRSV